MYSERDRCIALVDYMYYSNPKSLRKVAKRHNVSKSSLHRWVKMSPEIKRMKRTQKQIKVEMENCVDAAIQKNPFLSWAELAHKIKIQCGVSVSRSTAGRLLLKLQYTRKRAKKVVRKNYNPEQIIEFCDRYLANEQDIVCIDESYFHIGDKPAFGYAKRGSKLYVEMSRTLRQKKYTLLLAITRNGVAHSKILDGNCNAVEFAKFIEELNVPQNSKLLMDNVQFHKCKNVKDVLTAKNYEAMFTPPYAPKLNAIENVFGVLKTWYKKRCPFGVDDTFDYVGLFRNVLDKRLDLNPFFNRVKKIVLETIATRAVGFRGYDL